MTPGAEGPLMRDADLALLAQGAHPALHEHLGAHLGRDGTSDGVWFSVWAPGARSVRVVGDSNAWAAAHCELSPHGRTGVWEGFCPGAADGDRYMFELTTATGAILTKADPLAFRAEVAPATASVVHRGGHVWLDDEWMESRPTDDLLLRPLSVYEVHLGSWRPGPAEGGGEPGYRQVAEQLASYVTAAGFTHVELLPVMTHPFGGSWGYQVTSYFAPSPRWGSPDDFAALVDHLHQAGIGVILDWVPAHFPRDEWSLGMFDGTPLYEHSDPRRGAHPDWGTLVFDYGRPEVRSFLVSNAVFWAERYHVDGIRVDAVASMLYLDYSRGEGGWAPNRHGGRENLEAVEFLRQLNDTLHSRAPGVLSVAEESTAWPGVTAPTSSGGLGFDLKWNMGWMHDTLTYFSRVPRERPHHHHHLSFPIVYAFDEHFLLPLSHDEVVHEKRSLIEKMPGDRAQRFANLRALFGMMWAHPGKQLVFMGDEWGQVREWDHDGSLDWPLLDEPDHAGMLQWVTDLNHCYRERPALWATDLDPNAFTWLLVDDPAGCVFAFLRTDPSTGSSLACIANLSDRGCPAYRLGVPSPGTWRVVLDSDDLRYGGSGRSAIPGLTQRATSDQAQYELTLDLPPLTALWLEPGAAHHRGT